MARHQNIKGVLNGFLGTFTSRYSDYKGYWLFGVLLKDMEQLKIDLLNPEKIVAASEPEALAKRIAKEKFAEQMTKAGLEISPLQEAFLEITTRPGTVMGLVNGRASEGRNVNFRARVLFRNGKECESNKLVFVAPNNPGIEQRSARVS